MKRLLILAALGLCTSALAQSVTSNSTSSTIVSRDGSTVSSGTITSRDGSTVSSGNIISRDGSTVSSNTASGNAGSVTLDNQSSVTSSVTTHSTGVTTRSLVGRDGSMCSAVYEERRCEISCQAPQVAHCGKAESASEPDCYCK